MQRRIVRAAAVLSAGQYDGEPRSPLVAVDEHEAAMGLDRAMHDGQAEARAVHLGGEEGVEHPVADLGRNSGTRVADAERDGVRIEPDAGGNRVERAGRDLDAIPSGI